MQAVNIKEKIVLKNERLEGRVVCNVRDYVAIPKILLAVPHISMRAIHVYLKLLLIAGPRREINIANHWDDLKKEMQVTEDWLLESFEILCMPSDLLEGKSFIMYSVETDDLVITNISEQNKTFMEKVRHEQSPHIRESIAEQGEIKTDSSKISKQDLTYLNGKTKKRLSEYKNMDPISSDFLARENNKSIKFLRRVIGTPRMRPWDEERIDSERTARNMYQMFERPRRRKGAPECIDLPDQEADRGRYENIGNKNLDIIDPADICSQ